MANIEKKRDLRDIRNGVIYSVIAFFIISAAQYIGIPIRGWVWSFIKAVFHLLVYSVPLPLWLLLLLIIGVWPIIIGILILTGKKRESQPANIHERYITDSFNGAIWRWYWDESHISGLCPYCPKCDMKLQYDIGITRTIVSLVCPDCNYTTTSRPGSYDNLEILVKEQIYRKLRSGEQIKHHRSMV